MKVIKTPFEGLVILEPEVLRDNRGYFLESFNEAIFSQIGLPGRFVQENLSRSKRNVIRGLHFQKSPMSQSKLVWVVQGAIRDVVVDLRKSQPTYGKTFIVELTSENLKRIFVPVGFAHGFSVLSEYADVCYMCDEYYSAANQAGIYCGDPALSIDWGVAEQDRILSQKDMSLPRLDDVLSF